MKKVLIFSILLNFVLLCGLFFLRMGPHRQLTTPAPATFRSQSSASAVKPMPATAPDAKTELFHWNQLVSTGDYRTYIANLRAIGCPEPTIEDIVRGDTARVFSWERRQLGLDGSGTDSWSRWQELQLVASLLGARPPSETTTLAQSAGDGMEGNGRDNEIAGSAAPGQVVPNRRRGGGVGKDTGISMVSVSPGMDSPSYPLFLQNLDWGALGFTPEQQAAIAQVRQQFQSEMNGLNQTADNATGQDANKPDPGALSQWQKAMQKADEQLNGMLGGQAYMAYEQQQYYAWYQPQVAAAAASGGALTINPAASP